MSGLSSDELQARAANERRILRASAEELKSRVSETLDIELQVRQKVGLISGIAGIFAAALGYGVAGVFTRR